MTRSRVEFLDNDPDELILANYLKSKKDVKGQVLNATKAHLYAIALSEDPNSANEDVELAILESLQSLWGQMNYIVDYHRIRRKIHLAPQSLMRFGLGSTAPEGVVAHLQAQPLVRTMMPPKREVDEDEDEEISSNGSDNDNDDRIIKDFSDDLDSVTLDF